MSKLEKKKQNLLAFSLMIVVGIGLFFYGISYTMYLKHFNEVCEETIGTVYGYYTSHEDGNTSYYPKYRYEVDGEKYTVRGYRDYITKPRDGDTDTIYYDPANPEDATTRLKNNGPVVIVTGIVLAGVGVWVVIMLLKSKD